MSFRLNPANFSLKTDKNLTCVKIPGVHQWKVEVSHEIQDTKECSEEDAIFEVGIIEKTDEYSKENIEKGTTKKWVYSGPARKISNVFLNLDMEKKSLEILPGGRILRATSKFSVRRKAFHVKADSVFPFFAVNCPHCMIIHCGISHE